jgi:hypothetical protein
VSITFVSCGGLAGRSRCVPWPYGCSSLARAGPASDPYLTATAVVLAWLILGIALTVLTSRTLSVGKAAVVAAYAGVALLYINVMREQVGYGDFADYYNAAVSLLNRTPLPQRYLYPPLDQAGGDAISPRNSAVLCRQSTHRKRIRLVSSCHCNSRRKEQQRAPQRECDDRQRT